MVDFWASIGIACFYEPFLDQLLKNTDETIQKHMLRLNCLEYRELKRYLADSEIVAKMRELQKLASKRWICLPPRPCPRELEEEFAKWAEAHKVFLQPAK